MPCERREIRLARRRQQLVARDRAALASSSRIEIGERAADVDAYAKAKRFRCYCSILIPASLMIFV